MTLTTQGLLVFYNIAHNNKQIGHDTSKMSSNIRIFK